MIKFAIIGIFVSILMILSLQNTSLSYGQTTSPTVSPTTTVTPSPTGAVQGAAVPSGAPATGFGK